VISDDCEDGRRKKVSGEKTLKKLKMLKAIMKMTHADKLLISYVVFLVIGSFLIMLTDPTINTFGNALWYCYTMGVTIGFGDLVVTTVFAKVISVLISLYTILIVGMIPAIVVSYYLEVVKLREKETSTHFLYKLEHLSELSKEELEELSEKVKKFQKKQ